MFVILEFPTSKTKNTNFCKTCSSPLEMKVNNKYLNMTIFLTFVFAVPLEMKVKYHFVTTLKWWEKFIKDSVLEKISKKITTT